MRPLRPAIRVACLGAALTLSLTLTGCGWFPAWDARPAPPPDPSTATYRAAMAAFSDCATAAPQDRAGHAAALAQAHAQMAAITTPANPDHFFMADRVAAAHRYCAEAAAPR
jgi:hypothetical protein